MWWTCGGHAAVGGRMHCMGHRECRGSAQGSSHETWRPVFRSSGRRLPRAYGKSPAYSGTGEMRMQLPSDMRAFNDKLIAEFRANGGTLSGRLADSKLLLLLLTTIGARSGQPRVTPMG